MSQRDLVAELRAVQLTAPAEVRERVRLIAATAELSTTRRFLRRRSLLLVVPVAAALAGAVVLTRSSGHEQRTGLAAQSPPRHRPASSVTVRRSVCASHRPVRCRAP